MTLDPTTLPQVIDPAVPFNLAAELTSVASDTAGSLERARDCWTHLSEVFLVEGAEGLPFMLNGLAADASDFSCALTIARDVLFEVAATTLPDVADYRAEHEKTVTLSKYVTALQDYEGVQEEVRRFTEDVEAAEELLGSRFTQISGGDEVHGKDRRVLHSTQSFWGFADPAPAGSPRTTHGLADHLSRALSTATERRAVVESS